MSWLSITGIVLQLGLSIVLNWFQSNVAEKKRKDDLHAELADAIKARDAGRVSDLFNRLRS